MPIKNNTIFDIGLHSGEDTAFYLEKGYNVVAIDANIDMIEKAQQTFHEAIKDKRLQLVHSAIAEEDNKILTFYTSNKSEWSSLDKNIANRNGQFKETIQVNTTRLSSLCQKYGIPYYCKIDIENYDLIALKSLKTLSKLPTYISVESECLDDSETASEEQILASLELLYELGYQKFKLVDQLRLAALPFQQHFYKKVPFALRIVYKLIYMLQLSRPTIYNVDYISKKFNFPFKVGSSGPFGEDLEGEWLNYTEAKKHILFHRKDFFTLPDVHNYGFWCDWHAKK